MSRAPTLEPLEPAVSPISRAEVLMRDSVTSLPGSTEMSHRVFAEVRGDASVRGFVAEIEQRDRPIVVLDDTPVRERDPRSARRADPPLIGPIWTGDAAVVTRAKRSAVEAR